MLKVYSTYSNKPSELRFTAELVEESSINPQPKSLGVYYNVMRLFVLPDFIEWEHFRKGDDDEVTYIGIWTNADEDLIDYDGVFSLPKEAIELLRLNNITVGKEFEDA